MYRPVFSLDELRRLLDAGVGGVCIDVAHGHSARVMTDIGELKATHSDPEINAGNVCTAMA